MVILHRLGKKFFAIPVGFPAKPLPVNLWLQSICDMFSSGATCLPDAPQICNSGLRKSCYGFRNSYVLMLPDIYFKSFDMCHYQTLFHDDSLGYVVRCNECEKIQLGYGNMVITFSQDDFDAFRSWLVRIREEQDPAISSGLRCILIPTPCEGMKLLLSRRELDEFIVMLETADNELQSLALIRLFSVD